MKLRHLTICLLILGLLAPYMPALAIQESARTSHASMHYLDSAARSSPAAVVMQQDDSRQQPPEEGNLLFASDFRSELNGFQFRNYGRTHPEGDMTVDEARALFGDGVCAQIQGDTCIPAPAAELWIAGKNKTMGAGHCVGFTVMSYRLFEEDLAITQFGTQADRTYNLAQDTPIMRHIAQSYVMYYIPGLYKNNVVQGTPMELVNALLELQVPVDLSIFANDGAGHSMFGYGVRQTAAGLFEILVYDNNHPGADKAVLVDPSANTWSYEEGAVSPGDTTKRIWAGSARSAGTYRSDMEFIPLPAYTQSEQRCPKKLCTKEEASSTGTRAVRGTVLVTFDGEGDLLVSNERGFLAGRVFGHFINDIPEGELTPARGTRLSDNPPDIEVPADEELTVRVLTEYNQVGNLQLFGPDFAVTLDGLTVARGRTEEVAFSAVNQLVGYIANGDQTPTFKIAEDEYLLVLGGLKMDSESGVELSIDPTTQNVRVAGQGLTDETASMILIQLDNEQVNIFASNEIAIPHTGNVGLDIASWDGSGPLAVTVDANGDGTAEAVTLENQSIGDLIQTAQSGQEIVELVGELPAYMDGTQVDSFLASLAKLPLSGYDLGTAAFEFDLSDSRLLAFILQAGLLNNPQGLAQFLYAQNLESEARNRLITQLNLPADVLAELTAELAQMDAVRAAVLDWDFYNPDDKIEALPQFLDDRSFDADQTFVFLRTQEAIAPADKNAVVEKLSMSEAEKKKTLAALASQAADQQSSSEQRSSVEPSSTVTPTITPTVAPTVAPNVGAVNRSANLRSGPGTLYPVVASAREGESATATGINATGDWYQLARGAWIATFLVDGVTAQLPVVTAPPPPPTPTPIPATPTPVAEEPPEQGETGDDAGAGSPVIEFQASRQQIKQCECTQLSWHAEGVQSVYYQGQGQAGISSKLECPQATTTYTLQVFKTDGSEEVKQVTIDVTPDASCTPPTPTAAPPPRNENRNDNDNNNSNQNSNQNQNQNENQNENQNDNSEEDVPSQFESPLDTP